MANSKDGWIPIKEFLLITQVTPKALYYRVYIREWYEGFVLKKKGHKWRFGNLEHYKQWLKAKEGE